MLQENNWIQIIADTHSSLKLDVIWLWLYNYIGPWFLGFPQLNLINSSLSLVHNIISPDDPQHPTNDLGTSQDEEQSVSCNSI